MSVRVIVTIGLILFLLCCVFAVRFILTYNTIRSNAKDRLYVYTDMRPALQERSRILSTLLQTHKWRPSQQQEQLLGTLLPRLQEWQNANDLETEIQLLNSIIESGPAVFSNYSKLWEVSHAELYKQYASLTQDLASKKRHYNMLAKQYNIYINTFPWSIISFWASYKDASLFFLSAEEKQWVPAETIR